VRVLWLVSEQVLKRDSTTLRGFTHRVDLLFPGPVESELLDSSLEGVDTGWRSSGG
jgi:hypothetical protein